MTVLTKQNLPNKTDFYDIIYFLDGGSLLLCHPSDNLRKLVPESIFSVVHAPTLHTTNKPSSDFMDLDDTGNDHPFRRNENTTAGGDASVTDPHRKSNDKNKPNTEQNICLLSRPTMVFILESHNLEKLRYSMRRSLRVATCRIYSLQALNWLMRSVTQTSCLHDLMWWFVTSLKTVVMEDMTEKVDEGVSVVFRYCV